MARLMNGRGAADRDAERGIRTFLRILQRRLWLQHSVAWLWLGWRISAGLLVGAGLIHVGWRPVPLLPWLALAALPPVLALSAGLWLCRPSLADCAWLADRRFESRALLTSAWELLNAPRPMPASAPLILARAGQAASSWRQQLPVRFPWLLPGPARAALILSLGGIFLLATLRGGPGSTFLMPESPTPPLLLAPQIDRSAPPARPADDGPPASGATPAARQATRRPTEAGGASPARSSPGQPVDGELERAGGRLAAMPTGQAPPNDPGTPPDVIPGEGSRVTPVSSHAASTAVGLGTGDDAPGIGIDSRQARLDPAVDARLALRYVDLTRSGTAEPTVAAPGGELEPAVAAPPKPTAAAAPPPAERVSLPAGAAGGPALRRYVAAYFATRSPDDARSSDR